MKYLTGCLLFLVMAISAAAQLNDRDSIKKVFENYRSAILNDRAEDALNAIDSTTKNYYRQILKEVKSADSIKLSSLSMLDRVTILGIRARASKEEIHNMQGLDAFLFAIKNGMVGKTSIVDNTIGEAIIQGNSAKGELLIKGEPSSIFFHFYKEDSRWKLNITEMFPLSNSLFKKIIEKNGQTENEYLLQILSMMTGKDLTYEIWHPVE